MRSSLWADDSSDPSTSITHRTSSGHLNSKHSGSNVFRLLAQREVSPRTKRCSKKFCGAASKFHVDSKCEAAGDARHGLVSWVEAKSLRHLSAMYCPLQPPPRSTIAAAFSPDGKTLASTHGDHTVKVINCQTGKCLKVLSGHRRTPWVVRFHPLCPEILASGSLDHEVRLWDANTAECIGSRDFYRPIASIAFHAQGELLAVASGHKLYIWHYNRRGDTSSPTIVLKTRRSLRAVHFHPHGAPFLLTAEVNDMDSDSSMTLATSPGYLHYPPPTVYLADAHSAHRVGPSTSVRLLTYSAPSGQYELLLSPMEPSTSTVPEEQQATSNFMETENAVPPPAINDAMESAEVEPEDRSNQLFSFSDPRYWELPFLQGWLIGQSHAGQRMRRPPDSGAYENSSAFSEIENPAVMVPSVVPSRVGQSRVTSGSDSRHHSSHARMVPVTGSSEGVSSNNTTRIQTEIATSLTTTVAAAELPCTVRLRVWTHELKDACTPLDADRLTIPHAVLCSEMGAHFSPCGRFLAACVACVLPHLEGDPGFLSQVHHDVIGASTSPTRHPISAHQVIYELRIYSLEEATFGLVLSSRPIRAAHCLTSIQNFSHVEGSDKVIPVSGGVFKGIGIDKNAVSKLPEEIGKLNIEGSANLERSKNLKDVSFNVSAEKKTHFSFGSSDNAAKSCVTNVASELPNELKKLNIGKGSSSLDVFEHVTLEEAFHPFINDASSESRPTVLNDATDEDLVFATQQMDINYDERRRGYGWFSPTSEHLLLAYGRRHSSLLKSVVIDGDTTVPIYTILEIYRVSDMELVRVLPSAEDEVNVACFHPSVGSGLVYGTKEGKLRVLQYENSESLNCTISGFHDENMLEVPTYALEC
ncbi:hypothetical protein RHGRI_003720 [Rhododendron griersonianum]|uniref:Transducin family protein / WD-40 repeat family protein n=1 Tax=Rhododendron griersonianum TaxID=479676 RepID=A0AAV6L725_9ERIC|nr:hypothetical protein RHGRI_003720 [Rhododendron griersonianum]